MAALLATAHASAQTPPERIDVTGHDDNAVGSSDAVSQGFVGAGLSRSHGRGYTDLDFLLPELVQRIEYRKGPYFAQSGNFASAGAADIVYETLRQPGSGERRQHLALQRVG